MTATTTLVPSLAVPVIAPFRVDRIAGISATALDLDATSVDLMCAELDRVDREVQAMSSAVSDLLYRLVPALGDDTATRRVVLAVRRSCGGGGSRTPDPAKADLVSGSLRTHLGPEAQALFDRWLAQWQARERLLDDLDQAYAGDLEQSEQALRRVLANDDLVTGIAQASPWLGASLSDADLRPGKRAARSVGAYVSRAARKTSPFSYLTGVSTTVDDARGVRETVSIAQVHVVAWLEALAADEQLLAAFDLEPLWTPGRNPITDSVLVPEVSRHDGFTWRRDRAVHLSELGRVLGKLQFLGRRPATDYLEAIGGSDAFATVRRLIDVGIIRVVAPWSYGEDDRMVALADAIARLPQKRAQEVAATLRQIHGEAQALIPARGEQRARGLLRLQQRAEEAIASFGVSPQDAAFTVYSDTRSALRVDGLGAEVNADLESLGEAIRPMIFRSHLYDEIRDRFTARYGVGGTCPDVLGFLTTVTDDGEGLAGFFRAAAEDEKLKGQRTPRSVLPVGETSAAPTASVLFQVAAADPAAVHSGDYQLVVNQFHAGTGSLVSRFHGVGGDGLREALRDWACGVYPGVRVIEFIASSGNNDMQAACEGTFPRLRWPTERPVAADPAGSVDIDDLLMRHDAERDVLEFVTVAGDPVAPIYMGLVPAHLLGGAERVLSILADPWVNGAASSMRRLPPLAVAEGETRVGVRQQHGRIVTRRATWTVRAADLPRPERHESEAAYLRRLNTWRREAQIPDHVFVRSRSQRQSYHADERKPFWLSFLSPHAIAQLLALADQSTQGWTFFEVLPDDCGLWVADTHGNPYVAEHLSHLRWPRTDDRPPAPDPGAE